MTREISTVRTAADQVAAAGMISGGYRVDPMSTAGRAAGRPESDRGPVNIEVNFNNVVTDRLGVAREIKRILNEHDRLVVA